MNQRCRSANRTEHCRKGAGPSGSSSSAPPPAALAETFQALQRRLTHARLQAVEDLRHAMHVKWAAEDATSLSWTTGFPLLFFPSLFEEKSKAALHRARRQDTIHARSRELLGLTQSPAAR